MRLFEILELVVVVVTLIIISAVGAKAFAKTTAGTDAGTDAPKATHSFQVKTGKNVLLVKKGSAGWFESSIDNRVFGTTHNNFITLKAGDSTKGNAFEKANCPEDKDFCEFEIHVRGKGRLVYGSLYNFFGQHVRIIKLFDIKLVDGKLQLVDVPNSVTLKIKD